MKPELPPTILLVCTANQCRSPMAAALLHAEMGTKVKVVSAGFLDGGVPVPEPVVDAMKSIGIDVSDHVSRGVDEEMVAGADLIVTMTRQHAIDLATDFPEAWPRIFTATEVVHRGRQAGGPGPGESLRAWAERVSEPRARVDLLAERLADDVPDPTGGRRRDFERVRDLLAHWAADLAAVLEG